MLSLRFFKNCILLSLHGSLDIFALSLAFGLRKPRRGFLIACAFAAFQILIYALAALFPLCNLQYPQSVEDIAFLSAFVFLFAMGIYTLYCNTKNKVCRQNSSAICFTSLAASLVAAASDTSLLLLIKKNELVYIPSLSALQAVAGTVVAFTLGAAGLFIGKKLPLKFQPLSGLIFILTAVLNFATYFVNLR